MKVISYYLSPLPSVVVSAAAFSAFSLQAADVSPPVRCGFEEPDYKVGSIHGQKGWSVQQGRAEVIADTAHSGNRALKLFPADPFSQAKLSLSPGAPPSPVMFVDFFVRPAAGELADKEEFLDIDGARVGVFREKAGDAEAVIYFFHGDGAGGGEWVSTGVKLNVSGKANADQPWVRFTLREDFARQTWDLWIDGKPVAGDAGFQDANVGHAQNYIIMGDAVESVVLDDLIIAAANPYGPDTDLDGMVDSLEKELGLNPLFDDRDADQDGDGVRNVEEALLAAAGGTRLKVNAAETLPAAPVFSSRSGVVASPFEINLAGAGEGSRILTTNDGSDPRNLLSGAATWTGPRRIEKTTVLRAVVVDRRGRLSPTVTAAWIFPDSVAGQVRPAGVAETFRDVRFNGSQAVDLAVPFGVHAAEGFAASLKSAPILVVSAGSQTFFNVESGIYSRSSQKKLAAADVLFLDPSGNQTPAQGAAMVSISGESSRYHDVTAKHSLRLRFDGRNEMAQAVAGVATPGGSQVLLRHPTHDSWTVNGLWSSNRQDAKYFADSFAAHWMGDAGHLTLRRRWVHVFLDSSYWGAYEAIEQQNPDPAGVSDLLEAGPSAQTVAIFGETQSWRTLHRRLRELTNSAMNGKVDDAAWREAAATLDVPSLIDYILLNSWMTNLDWPERNYLIAKRGGQWRFVSWDAEWSLRRKGGVEVDMSARIQGAGDGPAYVFSSLCWWPEFRSQVGLRLKTLTASGGMLHPEVLAARAGAAADDFRRLLPAEAARWGDLMETPGALAQWETHLAWLREKFIPVRTETVSGQMRAMLDQFALRATEAEQSAKQRTNNPAELITVPFRPLTVVPDTNGDADGDGIKDEWELTHGLDPKNSSDGALDSDGDGLSNLTEFLLGRDSGRFEPTTNVFAVQPAGVGTRTQLPKIKLGRRVNVLSRPLSVAEEAAAITEEVRERERGRDKRFPATKAR